MHTIPKMQRFGQGAGEESLGVLARKPRQSVVFRDFDRELLAGVDAQTLDGG